MSLKGRFRSKRTGKTKRYNANGQGVTTSTLGLVIYTATERETLMGIRGNISVRPTTATGAIFFSIQILRGSIGASLINPQNDSENYQGFLRLWDYTVNAEAEAVESILVEIVSKKRRKLFNGDTIQIVYNSNVATVGVFSIQTITSLLKA